MTSKAKQLETAAEIMAVKNWTGLTLAELCKAGRCTPKTAAQWAKEELSKRGIITCTFHGQGIIDAVEAEAETLFNS